MYILYVYIYIVPTAVYIQYKHNIIQCIQHMYIPRCSTVESGDEEDSPLLRCINRCIYIYIDHSHTDHAINSFGWT